MYGSLKEASFGSFVFGSVTVHSPHYSISSHLRINEYFIVTYPKNNSRLCRNSLNGTYQRADWQPKRAHRCVVVAVSRRHAGIKTKNVAEGCRRLQDVAPHTLDDTIAPALQLWCLQFVWSCKVSMMRQSPIRLWSQLLSMRASSRFSALS